MGTKAHVKQCRLPDPGRILIVRGMQGPQTLLMPLSHPWRRRLEMCLGQWVSHAGPASLSPGLGGCPSQMTSRCQPYVLRNVLLQCSARWSPAKYVCRRQMVFVWLLDGGNGHIQHVLYN